MGPIGLSYDIWLLVAEHLGAPDCLSLAATCKELQAMLPNQTLRDVALFSPRNLSLFIDFVFTAHNRACRIRSLLVQSTVVGDIPKLLSRLLLYTSNLSTLLLKFYCGVSIRQLPAFAEAIKSLPSLTELEVFCVDSTTLKSLFQMRSHLRRLHITQLYADDIEWAYTHGGCLETVEELVLEDCGDEDSEILVGRTSTWPSVRKLTILNTDVSLEDLVECFPNVKEFTFREIGPQFCPYKQDRSKTYFWPYLDRLTLSWEDIPLMPRGAITLPRVRTLLFSNTYDETCALDDADRFQDVMEQTQCVVLSYPIIATSSRPSIDAIPPPLGRCTYDRLRCLTITLLEQSMMEGIFAWLDNLSSNIGDLPLVAFCLCIQRPYDVPREEVLKNLDPTVTHYHIPTVVSRLVTRTRFIGVDIKGEQPFEPYWWCTSHDETLVRIPDGCNDLLSRALEAMDDTPEGLSRVKSTLPRDLLDSLPQDKDGPILYPITKPIN